MEDERPALHFKGTLSSGELTARPWLGGADSSVMDEMELLEPLTRMLSVQNKRKDEHEFKRFLLAVQK